MKGEVLEKIDGSQIEVLTEPYPVQTEDGQTYYVLVSWLNGSSADSLDQLNLDHLVIYWKRLRDS